MTAEHYTRLEQRMLYLRERIKAKRKLKWETVYDQSEHDALRAALRKLKRPRTVQV